MVTVGAVGRPLTVKVSVSVAVSPALSVAERIKVCSPVLRLELVNIIEPFESEDWVERQAVRGLLLVALSAER